jgi:MoaA/NifB/PqqE/SkfB family radical SAM enzyme
MSRPLTILWRGPLDSCNYGCRYCPFAKRPALRSVLDADRNALARFTGWVEAYPQHQLSVFVTPWGEALIHAWYRDTLIAMSHMAHVQQAVIQTNGSCSMAWTADANPTRLALWITWHPTEITLDRFLDNLKPLIEGGIRFSVGAVGVPEQLVAVEQLRSHLPISVPCWVNARKPLVRYSADEIARFTAIDAHFPLTLRAHPSRNRACRTGEDVISVDGDGTVKRCHFVDTMLGNIYNDDLAAMLKPRPCPRAFCDCYIGFAHLDELHLDEIYGDGLLARIPIAYAS